MFVICETIFLEINLENTGLVSKDISRAQHKYINIHPLIKSQTKHNTEVYYINLVKVYWT